MNKQQINLFTAPFVIKENWQVNESKLKDVFYHLKYPDVDFEESEVDKMVDEFHYKIGRNINWSIR
jgi:hypothetical protein